MKLAVLGRKENPKLRAYIEGTFNGVDYSHFSSVSDFVMGSSTQSIVFDRMILSPSVFDDIKDEFKAFCNYMLTGGFPTRVFVLCDSSTDINVYTEMEKISLGVPSISMFYIKKVSMSILGDFIDGSVDSLESRYGRKAESINVKSSNESGSNGNTDKKGGFFGRLLGGKKSRGSNNSVSTDTADLTEDEKDFRLDIAGIGSDSPLTEDYDYGRGVSTASTEDETNWGAALGTSLDGTRLADTGANVMGVGSIRSVNFESTDSVLVDNPLGDVDFNKALGITNEIGVKEISEDGEDIEVGFGGIGAFEKELAGKGHTSDEISGDLGYDESKMVNAMYVRPSIKDVSGVVSSSPTVTRVQRKEVSSIDDDLGLDYTIAPLEKQIVVERVVVKEEPSTILGGRGHRSFFVVTGDRRSGVTRTALKLASEIHASKGKVLYVDCDIVRHGVISYIDLDEYVDMSDRTQMGLLGVKEVYTIESSVAWFRKFGFSMLLSPLGERMGKDRLTEVMSTISLQTIYDTVVIDCPFENIECLKEILPISTILVVSTSDKGAVFNLVTMLESIDMGDYTDKLKALLSRQSVFMTFDDTATVFQNLIENVVDIYGLDEVGRSVFNWSGVRTITPRKGFILPVLMKALGYS